MSSARAATAGDWALAVGMGVVPAVEHRVLPGRERRGGQMRPPGGDERIAVPDGLGDVAGRAVHGEPDGDALVVAHDAEQPGRRPPPEAGQLGLGGVEVPGGDRQQRGAVGRRRRLHDRMRAAGREEGVADRGMLDEDEHVRRPAPRRLRPRRRVLVAQVAPRRGAQRGEAAGIRRPQQRGGDRPHGVVQGEAVRGELDERQGAQPADRRASGWPRASRCAARAAAPCTPAPARTAAAASGSSTPSRSLRACGPSSRSHAPGTSRPLSSRRVVAGSPGTNSSRSQSSISPKAS